MNPTVWSIGGFDSSSGAGITADLQCFQRFKVPACSVLTTSTAQHASGIDDIVYLPASHVKQQLQTLAKARPASVIKLGLLGSLESMQVIANFLATYQGFSILDPIRVASCGHALLETGSLDLLRERILPYITLLTPNLPEASALLEQTITDHKQACRQLQALGPRMIVLKGGHAQDDIVSDFIAIDEDVGVLQHPRIATAHQHGTGCALASAIAAQIAQGRDPVSAITAATAYVQQGLHDASEGAIAHSAWPASPRALPCYQQEAAIAHTPPFETETLLGLYAIVDNLTTLEQCLQIGIRCIQWRVKQHIDERELKQAITQCRRQQVKLYINDHWQLAIAHHAYGVHLGQDDLIDADIDAIRQAGLRLGISCHNDYELACAHRYKPSYVGFGPIFPTSTKALHYPTQGFDRLKEFCALSPYPVVAIGGLNIDQLDTIFAQGAQGAALISGLRPLLTTS